MKPELLTMGNIPKPLHGVNPRNLMGYTEWRKLTYQIKKDSPARCQVCGVHTPKGRLDVHEDYEIDYAAGRVEVKGFVLLCKKCHAFIHSGLLRVNIRKGIITKKDAREILIHGMNILKENDLPIFYGTADLARELGLKVELESWIPRHTADWDQWHLIWNGYKYYSPFEDEHDWNDHYSNALSSWKKPLRIEKTGD